MKRLFIAMVLTFAAAGYSQEVGPDEVGYYGRVMDTAGVRLQGARVDIYDVPTVTALPYATVFVGSLETDENGAFAFSRRREKLRGMVSHVAIAVLEGYSIGWTSFRTTTTELPVLVLEKGSAALAGRVVDAGDRPVEGATVYAIIEYDRRQGRSTTAGGPPELCCVTDAEGTFRIGDLPLSLKAELCAIKEGYAWTYTFRTDKPLERSLRPGREDIRLVLYKEASLEGVLRRSDTGVPLPGEMVSIIRNQGEKTRLYTVSYADKSVTVPPTLGARDNRSSLTDAEGKFAFEHLVPGQYTLFHHNLECAERGLFSKKMKIDLPEGQTRTVEVPVFAGEALELKGMLGEGKAPAAGAVVTLKRQYKEGEEGFLFFLNAQSTGDSDGRFHFNVPPGSYEVGCGKEYQLAQPKTVLTVPSASYPVVRLAAAAAAEIKAPQGAGILRGRCVNAAGEPLKDARVRLLSDPESEAVTDATGRYEIAASLERCRKNVQPVLDRRQQQGADWMPPIPLSAAVMDRLEAQRSTDGAWLPIPAVLVAETADRKLKAIRRFTHHFLMNAPSGEAELVLKPACVVTGRVLNEDRQPIAHASVRVDLLDDRVSNPLYVCEECTTDAQGRFSVRLCDGEKYVIAALNSDGGVFMKHLTAHVGPGVDAIEEVSYRGKEAVDAGDFVVSSPVHRVAGIVTDYLGRPVQKAQVRLHAPAQGIDEVYVRTGEDGRFEFCDLSSGPVELWAKYNKTCTRRTAAPAENVRMILFDKEIAPEHLGSKPAPSAAVELRIVEAGTEEAVTSRNLEVRVESKDGPSFIVHPPDAEGKLWMFLEAGEYALRIWDKDDYYQQYKGNFQTELNNVHRVSAALKPSQKLLAHRGQGLPYWPEVLTDDGRWIPQTGEVAKDRYRMLEIGVTDRETGKPVADADIRLSFNEGKGRFKGKTNAAGKAYFGVGYNSKDVVVDSIGAEGYADNKLGRKLNLYFGDSQYRQAFELKQEPSYVMVTVLDEQGRPAPDQYVYHYYFREKWHRTGTSRTDENGRADVPWLREFGTDPQIDHFLCIWTNRGGKDRVAAMQARAHAGEELVLHMTQGCVPQGRIVDMQGTGVGKVHFNFDYVVNGNLITGPPARSDAQGYYGGVPIVPGFDYRLRGHRSGQEGPALSFEMDFRAALGQGVLELPDCVAGN
ncbi:MAG: carboxypeptidase regulatory-like domain-containing protein [Phycisphaerae bacterium]|nr:carboxypeptidase regulatory-like domain-containing protein [Phycisphaerae bacterium]